MFRVKVSFILLTLFALCASWSLPTSVQAREPHVLIFNVAEEFGGLVNDLDKGIQDGEVVFNLYLILLIVGLGAFLIRVEAPDADVCLHQYSLSSGCHWVITIGMYSLVTSSPGP